MNHCGGLHQAITGGMVLGEIGKSSPFYATKGFIPSNSTLDPPEKNSWKQMEMEGHGPGFRKNTGKFLMVLNGSWQKRLKHSKHIINNWKGWVIKRRHATRVHQLFLFSCLGNYIKKCSVDTFRILWPKAWFSIEQRPCHRWFCWLISGGFPFIGNCWKTCGNNKQFISTWCPSASLEMFNRFLSPNLGSRFTTDPCSVFLLHNSVFF